MLQITVNVFVCILLLMQSVDILHTFLYLWSKTRVACGSNTQNKTQWQLTAFLHECLPCRSSNENKSTRIVCFGRSGFCVRPENTPKKSTLQFLWLSEENVRWEYLLWYTSEWSELSRWREERTETTHVDRRKSNRCSVSQTNTDKNTHTRNDTFHRRRLLFRQSDRIPVWHPLHWNRRRVTSSSDQ